MLCRRSTMAPPTLGHRRFRHQHATFTRRATVGMTVVEGEREGRATAIDARAATPARPIDRLSRTNVAARSVLPGPQLKAGEIRTRSTWNEPIFARDKHGGTHRDHYECLGACPVKIEALSDTPQMRPSWLTERLSMRTSLHHDRQTSPNKISIIITLRCRPD
jgi:hypothetical protein